MTPTARRCRGDARARRCAWKRFARTSTLPSRRRATRKRRWSRNSKKRASAARRLTPSIISTIVEREYVNKDQGRFTPTMLGEKVSVLLVKSFEDIFDVGFTARMEEELDEIEEGKLPWREAVKEFWDRFAEDSDRAKDEMESYKAGIPTGAKVREVRRRRTARAHQPPRIFPGLLALSRLRFHPRSFSKPPAEGSEDDAAENRVLRQLRQGNGHQARALGQFLACTGYPDCKTTGA